MMTSLAEKTCVPCKGGVPPIQMEEGQRLLADLVDWQIVHEHHLRKVKTFPDFVTALAYVNKIGALAEQVGHHPDLLLAWGRVEITIFTHDIDGLTESDFILAAKIDRL